MLRQRTDLLKVVLTSSFETVFDTLNAKAALHAVKIAFEETGVELPLMVSGTITDRSGRTLSGQTTEAFWNSIKHSRPFAVGLNCALGAEEMRPYVAEFSRIADTNICIYPNAGLPNESVNMISLQKKWLKLLVNSLSWVL